MDFKVGIIIPLFNQQDFISDCLESVISQTLKELQIIVINDGSTDDSMRIVEEFALKDERIMIINQPNRGVSAARNAGIDKCCADYVCFLDPDDYYPSYDVIEKLYMAVNGHDVVMAAGSYSDEKNGVISCNYTGLYSKMVFQTEGIINFEEYQFILGFQRFIFRTDFLKINTIVFPDFIIFEDPIFLLKVMSLCRHFYAIPDSVYVHRIGHQKYDWSSRERIVDLICAITEGLYESSNLDYAEIHKFLIDRVNNRYCDHIVSLIRKTGDVSVLSALIEMNDAVNTSLLKEDYRNQKCVLKPLKKVMQEPVIVKVKEPVVESMVQNRISYAIGCSITFLPRMLLDLVFPTNTLRRDFIKEFYLKFRGRPNRLSRLMYFVTIRLKKTKYEVLSHIPGSFVYRNIREIKKLEKSHLGERCFIIGNGPSLQIEDLELISGEFSFAVNRIYNVYEKTKWRPSFYYTQEMTLPNRTESLEEFLSSFLRSSTSLNFLPYIKGMNKVKSKYNCVFFPVYMDYCEYLKKPINRFSLDCSKEIVHAYTSLYSVLQIAIYMGFKEIYLLGVDGAYRVNNAHFYDDVYGDKRLFETKRITDRLTENINRGFDGMKAASERYDFKIYNCTRGGSLEKFPRCNLENLMKKE